MAFDAFGDIGAGLNDPTKNIKGKGGGFLGSLFDEASLLKTKKGKDRSDIIRALQRRILESSRSGSGRAGLIGAGTR